MASFIYTMKGLGKIYPPDSVVFKDIWLSFLYGAKIGVLGANGSGKSTLLRIMAGLDQDYQGEATLSAGYTVGYLPQEPRLDPTKTVLGNVEEGVASVRALLTRFDEINAKFAEDLSPEAMDKVLEEQAKVQDAIDAAGAWDLDSKLEHAMDALRLPPADADVETLSGGERRRVALCRLLLQSPDLLLLDEPTNDLDIATLEILEESLLEYTGALVLVTHDRYMLDRVSTVVLGLDGKGGSERFSDYSQWEQWRGAKVEDAIAPGATGKAVATATSAAAPAAGGKKKLSYLEAREFAGIEAAVEAAEERLQAAREMMERQDVVTDAAKLTAALAEMEAAQTAADGLYARWAELTEKAG